MKFKYERTKYGELIVKVGGEIICYVPNDKAKQFKDRVKEPLRKLSEIIEELRD